MCDCAKCKAVRAASVPVVYEQPKAGQEFTIRYRVLGQSAVWPDQFTVCEVVGGPQDGKVRLLDHSDFTTRLSRARRIHKKGVQ